MPKVIKISDVVIQQLDKLRHIGQSYDGVLRELLRKCGRTIIKHPDDSSENKS